ncbi:MAG: 4Fe-4S dicluster domain-containing protein [Planctomycetota bacterium]|nr:MAG: 4Fe-4S dicluster domain-containing protein [Planctomycetota bacterium]
MKTLLVLLAVLVAFAGFAYQCYQRLSLLKLGRAGPPPADWGQRWKAVLVFVLGQKRLFRFPAPGTAHFLLFWGFLILLPTILAALLEGLFPDFVLPFFGSFGPLLLAQDLVAVLVAGAVLYGLYLRVLVKPKRYQGSHQGEGVLVLAFIFTIMASLLVLNGLRIEREVAPNPQWQPVSKAIGAWFGGLSFEAQHFWEEFAYWIHLGIVLVFLNLLPRGKHFHVVTSLFTVLLRNQEARGRLPEAVSRDGLQGAGDVRDFPRRWMLDWYSCTQCGRCQEVCPAFQSGQDLSPKKLIMGLREELERQGKRAAMEGGAAAESLADRVLSESGLWACTTCFACDQECPLFIQHLPEIVDMRRRLLAEGHDDEQLMTALNKLRRYGNSFGESERKRARWTKALDFKIPDARKKAVKTLWFLGDYSAYSPALAEATKATAEVFHRAKEDFGILYDGERNSGNDVRRVGEEGLFQMLAQKNGAALAKARFERIVCGDPHTYNTLRNEYDFGEKTPEVLHFSEWLLEALKEGRLPIGSPLGHKLTYHDPCYLGRYNDIYEAPRQVLQAIGCQVVEMPRNRDRALCCGAGGGRIWMDESGIEDRPSEQRVLEAAALEGVRYFVVACPKDLTMYRDAVKTKGLEDRLQVVELAELVAQALVIPAEVGASADLVEPSTAGETEKAALNVGP